MVYRFGGHLVIANRRPMDVFDSLHFDDSVKHECPSPVWSHISGKLCCMSYRFGLVLLGLVFLLSFHAIINAGRVVAGDSFRFTPVSRDVIEARLKKYQGNDQQREATLKGLFGEAGCDDQHLSEQPVKRSHLPNVVCILPGTSDKTIIVGAHFDHVSEGDGVVDNWSGASLLPSLYQTVRIRPRKHTYIFVGFTDEEKGEVGSHFYAGQMTKEQVSQTEAMVNMDTLGLGPQKSGPRIPTNI
jgi:hypothetical protein